MIGKPKMKFIGLKRLMRTAALASVFCGSGEVWCQTSNWAGNGGVWSNANNWVGNIAIASSNTSIANFLSSASPYTSTIDGSYTLNQLNISDANATVSCNGQTLTLAGLNASATISAGNFNLGSGTISGGNWTQSGTGSFFVGGGSGPANFNNVHFSGNIISQGFLNGLAISNNTTFASGSTIDLRGIAEKFIVNQSTVNNLEIRMNTSSNSSCNVYNSTGGPITFGPNTLIRSIRGNCHIGTSGFAGGPNAISIINQGVIRAEANPTGPLYIEPQGTFRNTGTLVVVAGGQLNLYAERWQNRDPNGGNPINGTIDIQGGVLAFGGTFNSADLGNFTRTTPTTGTVYLVGTMNNTGNTMTFNDNTGTWLMAPGSQIVGGTVKTIGSNVLSLSYGGGSSAAILDGVNVDGKVQFTIDSAVLQVKNGSSFTPGSTVDLASPGTRVEWLQPTIEVAEIRLNAASNGNATLRNISGAQVTIKPTAAVRNLRGNGFIDTAGFSGNGVSFLNQTTITAEGGSLVISPVGIFRNTGTMQVNAGAELHIISTNWQNRDPNGGNPINGTIHVTGGLLDFGGTFDTANLGTFVRDTPTTGTVRISGAAANTGNTLALNSSTGSWAIFEGGSITGGSLTTSGTNVLTTSAAHDGVVAGTLDGVAVNGRIDVVGNHRLRIQGGTSFAAGSTVNQNSYGANLEVNQALLDNVTVNLHANLNGSNSLINTSNNKLTIGGNAVIENNSASGFGHLTTSGFVGNGVSISNQGIIRATAAVLTVDPTGTFENLNTLHANGGGIAIADATNFSNYAAGTQTLSGGIYRMENGGNINLGNRPVAKIAGGTTVYLSGATSQFAALQGNLANVSGTLSVNTSKSLSVTAAGMHVNSGGLLTGNGGILANGLVTVDVGGTVSPGASPGTLTFNSGLSINGDYVWELGANSVAGAGTNYDQLIVAAGNAAVSNTARVFVNLTGTANYSDPFWQNAHEWVIVAQNGIGSVSGAFSNGNIFYSGGFGLYSSEQRSYGVVLQWSPVPEPTTLFAVAALGLAAVGLARGSLRTKSKSKADSPPVVRTR